MSDEHDPWKAGHQNRQWQYGMDSAQFNAGREQREREEAERQRQWRENAERNAGGNSSSSAPGWGGQSGWSPGTSTGGGEGGGLGLVILLGLGGAAWLVWTFLNLLLGAALGIAVVTGVTGTAIWGAAAAAGGRIGWWEVVKQSAIALLILLAAAAMPVLLAVLSLHNGGPEILPGFGALLTDTAWRSNQALSGAWPGLALIAALGIAAGTWRLHKALPVTPKLQRPARWAGLAALLLLAPAAGIWLALRLWAMASPVPVGPLLGNAHLLAALAAAIGAGALLAALAGGTANVVLRKRGWRVSTRGYAAGQAAKGFLAYAACLLLLGIMYRAGDSLLIGIGQLISPWQSAAGATQSGVLSGLPGFLLLQLAPFGLFAAIVRETQHERKAIDKLRLLAAAQALVLAIALLSILLFWAVAFALAR